MLAMAGKDSVVIASDSRFSSYQTGTFLLGEFPRYVYQVGSKTLVGFYGLDSDARSVMDEIQEKLLHHVDRDVSCKSIARLLSDTLYSSGLQCSPIIAGLDEDCVPRICSMDGLGMALILY